MFNRKDIFYQLYRNIPIGERASFKNVPIVLLEDFKKSFKNDFKFRIRYRGPRPYSKRRALATRQSTCLKRDAERFSVYRV